MAQKALEEWGHAYAHGHDERGPAKRARYYLGEHCDLLMQMIRDKSEAVPVVTT